MTDDIKNIIESLLLVSESPLATDRIKQVIPSADTKEIKDALQMLSYEYEARKGGLFLCEVGGGYQLRTRPEYAEWVRCLIQPKPVRLSKPALETLAIIAYKQPVIRSDIEHIRGVDSGGVIRMLLERKFIRILGRKEIPGRPLIYATTKQFLEVFGLKDLRDLPTPKEIEAFGNSPSENDDVHKPSDGAENSVPEGKDFAGPKETETPLSESDKAEVSPDVKNEDIGSLKETEVSENPFSENDRAEQVAPEETGPPFSENDRAEQVAPEETGPPFSENDKTEMPSELKSIAGQKETDASEKPPSENGNIQMLSEDSEKFDPDGEKNA